jgi:hypothetical protein
LKIFPYNKELYSKVLEYYNNEDILGGVILANKEVDEFFINQKYQGQEYGRKLNFASTIEPNEPHVGGLNSCLQAIVF